MTDKSKEFTNSDDLKRGEKHRPVRRDENWLDFEREMKQDTIAGHHPNESGTHTSIFHPATNRFERPSPLCSDWSPWPHRSVQQHEELVWITKSEELFFSSISFDDRYFGVGKGQTRRDIFLIETIHEQRRVSLERRILLPTDVFPTEHRIDLSVSNEKTKRDEGWRYQMGWRWRSTVVENHLQFVNRLFQLAVLRSETLDLQLKSLEMEKRRSSSYRSMRHFQFVFCIGLSMFGAFDHGVCWLRWTNPLLNRSIFHIGLTSKSVAVTSSMARSACTRRSRARLTSFSLSFSSSFTCCNCSNKSSSTSSDRWSVSLLNGSIRDIRSSPERKTNDCRRRNTLSLHLNTYLSLSRTSHLRCESLTSDD